MQAAAINVASTGMAFTWVEQQCPICEIPPSRFLGRRGGAAHRAGAGLECSIWECGRCSLIFPNPMPLPVGGAQALYALDADEYFVNHDDAERELLNGQLVEQAAMHAGRRGRMLDIGSGRGELLAAALRGGWEVVGLEPSPTFAAVARTRAPGADLREIELLDAQLPAASFDAIILQAVLEHLHDPDPILAEVSRLLAPGGVFYADVPNERGLYARLGNLYQRLSGRDWVVNLSPTFSPFHVFGYSVRSLTALYTKHGLQPVRFDVGGGASLLPRRAGLKGAIEQAGASMITHIANATGQGTYIASWARQR
jgi:SAM-dependent methyltransferase